MADATGLPVPVILNKLVRQRQIDELTMDALRHVGENADTEDKHASKPTGDAESSTDSWFYTFCAEANIVDEENVRKAFTRVFAGEMQAPVRFPHGH